MQILVFKKIYCWNNLRMISFDYRSLTNLKNQSFNMFVISMYVIKPDHKQLLWKIMLT